MSSKFKDLAIFQMACERFDFAVDFAAHEDEKRAIAFQIAAMYTTYHKGLPYSRADYGYNGVDNYANRYVARLSLSGKGRAFLRWFTTPDQLPHPTTIYKMMDN